MEQGRRVEESRIFELSWLSLQLEYSAGDHCDSAPNMGLAFGVRVNCRLTNRVNRNCS